MEVDLTSKRLTCRVAQSIQGDLHEAVIGLLDVRTAKSRGVEVARKKLQKAKMGSCQVVDKLLPLEKRLLVRRCKLLLKKKWVMVTATM